MGGIGSGRRHQGGKERTEDSRPLDIRKLKRGDLLQPGRSFGWQWTINKQPVSDIEVRVHDDHVVLAYSCQRESADDRLARRADRIRRRLGWRVGILNPQGEKPKGMHRSIFARLTAAHDAFAQISLTLMAQGLGLVNRQPTGLGLEPLADLGHDGDGSVSQNR